MNTDMIFFVNRKYIRKKFLTTYLPKKFHKLSSSIDIRKIKKLFLKDRFCSLNSYYKDYIYYYKLLFYLDTDVNHKDLIITNGVLFDQAEHTSFLSGIRNYKYTNLNFGVRYLFVIYSLTFIVTNVSSLEIPVLNIPVLNISKPYLDNKLLKRYLNESCHFKNLVYNAKTIQCTYL